MTDPKKPGVAFWATVALVAVLAYPLSFGPACWAYSRVPPSKIVWEVTSLFYSPILRVWLHDLDNNGTISDLIEWYANLGAAVDVTVAETEGSVYIATVTYSVAP